MGALKNKKYETFCLSIVADTLMNGTKAALAAGFSEKSARNAACRLLKREDINARIDELRAERIERLRIDSDYVLLRLYEQDQLNDADIMNEDGSIKPIHEWSSAWQRGINGFEMIEYFEGKGEDREQVGVIKKFKRPDRAKILELLGKHTSVRAFAEIQERNTTITDLTDDELRARIAAFAKAQTD
ncbi:terminase small subunit [Vibrio harveyi]|uniref:terminase small subunit n=1 Tax=Vibrio harveyi TaxID=669 RepID=UPI00217EBBD0|nr:terminase small subunit [Vibrio harveyi]